MKEKFYLGVMVAAFLAATFFDSVFRFLSVMIDGAFGLVAIYVAYLMYRENVGLKSENEALNKAVLGLRDAAREGAFVPYARDMPAVRNDRPTVQVRSD